MSRKDTFRWYSPHIEQEVQLVRWGEIGTPVLLFPTAGGDAEEVERFHLIRMLEPLIDAGRIKVYSTDSVAGKAWISGTHSGDYCSKLQNLFDAFIYKEVTPAIRKDCASNDIEIVATGASIGAFNAVATVCRHPDAYKLAIAMSGTFDLSKYLEGKFNQDFYFSSPLHYLPGLEGEQLNLLRKRLILLPTGEGDYEDIGESWRIAKVLGAKGIPNRVDPWGTQYNHNWVTWREMLPKYLDEFA
ncbi:MAG: alpha/beta hydrolase-fold protein [Gammaproteobacteria bacterium]|nr:alpha/beta hydrolase-fold protein [Gammaproteobacteria bacterium]MDH4314351.1 alpha/beta hydrolase-fold protein [Gammaproteobacteria bacterium]MDH5214531.1 alpha/beta hydrolase-fold protein [Gammaproteobacteria bacterium]MDH5500802.1 alpha/beta hydrolase-fold protein [Gammaproteobacteria bacterium]